MTVENTSVTAQGGCVSSPGIASALDCIEQRLNESGTGEMGLLNTIHAAAALVRALRSSLQPATPTGGEEPCPKCGGKFPCACVSYSSAGSDEPAQVPFYPEAVRAMEALEKRSYSMSEPHLSGYRLVIGFENLPALQAAQQALADLPPMLAGRAAALSRPPAQPPWQPIETNPFVSAKRYLITEGDRLAIPFVGFRVYEAGPWIHDGYGEVYPTHWMELPDTSSLSSTEGK